VVKVTLEGLKIARARGKWYVYHRATGTALLTGFVGSKDALRRKLAEPDFIGAYNSKRKRGATSYPENTLGWLVNWFRNLPEFTKLAEVTRKGYAVRLDWLEPEFDIPLKDITTASLYNVRDKAASAKWPHFGDQVIKVLSSMFGKAVKRGLMDFNPAYRVDKVHKSDPNANREWHPQEWEVVSKLAPPHFLTLLMIARFAGFRGQTVTKLKWANYQPDPKFGKCFRITVRKNNEQTWIPAVPELQIYLDGLDRDKSPLFIATRYNGLPWKNENQMQKQISNWLNKLEEQELVGEGLTLHGCRVSFAAGKKRAGADTSEVAAALGDRTTRMGEHYTRHVEEEQKVIRAFAGRKTDSK
jgi:hypothetical protein